MTEVDMYIRSLNNLPFSKTSTITGECQLGWIQTFRGGLEIAPQFQGLLLKRTGTENIFGTAAGSKYPVIGSRENYKENLLSALLSIPLTWRVQQNSLKIDIRPSAIIGREEQKLLSPSLNSSQSFFTPMASGSISMIPTQKFSFTIEGGISRRYISEQNFGFQAGIGVSYALGETALHLGVKWEHENRFYSENYNFFGTSLSIIF